MVVVGRPEHVRTVSRGVLDEFVERVGYRDIVRVWSGFLQRCLYSTVRPFHPSIAARSKGTLESSNKYLGDFTLPPWATVCLAILLRYHHLPLNPHLTRL